MMRRCLALLAMTGVSPLASAGEQLSAMWFNVRGDFDQGIATDRPHGWLALSGPSRREAALAFIAGAGGLLLRADEINGNQALGIRKSWNRFDSR